MSEALLAALAAFCITSLTLFFGRMATGPFSGLAVFVVIYVVISLVASGISIFVRMRTNK